MTALAASACQASGRLEIQVKDGRVAIDAQATTVQEILDALVARGLVRVTADEASSFRARLTTVNKRFGRRDLATALDSVLIEIPHELVRGANGAVTEVRLVSPLLRGRSATTTAYVEPRAIVEPVRPSKAALRAGRSVAAGAVPATSLPPVTSSSFTLEAEPEGTGPGGPPAGASAGSSGPVSGYGRNQSGGGAPSNALAARIAERRAAIQQRNGAPGYPSSGQMGTQPASVAPVQSAGGVATAATVAPVVVAAATSRPAPARVSNRPPIAPFNPLEVPANPYRINGLEMPSLASAEEKSGYRARHGAQ